MTGRHGAALTPERRLAGFCGFWPGDAPLSASTVLGQCYRGEAECLLRWTDTWRSPKLLQDLLAPVAGLHLQALLQCLPDMSPHTRVGQASLCRSVLSNSGMCSARDHGGAQQSHRLLLQALVMAHRQNGGCKEGFMLLPPRERSLEQGVAQHRHSRMGRLSISTAAPWEGAVW